MIQLMTFLIAQLMFVPVYLKVTDTCTENKGTFWQKIKIISISPFAVYLYVNIFFAFAMAFIPASIAEKSGYVRGCVRHLAVIHLCQPVCRNML